MSAPTVSTALRLAEAIPVTGENYRTVGELIKELKELAATTAEQVLATQYATSRARFSGLITGADK